MQLVCEKIYHNVFPSVSAVAHSNPQSGNHFSRGLSSTVMSVMVCSFVFVYLLDTLWAYRSVELNQRPGSARASDRVTIVTSYR
jgi:hypothetical protein